MRNEQSSLAFSAVGLHPLTVDQTVWNQIQRDSPTLCKMDSLVSRICGLLIRESVCVVCACVCGSGGGGRVMVLIVSFHGNQTVHIEKLMAGRCG